MARGFAEREQGRMRRLSFAYGIGLILLSVLLATLVVFSPASAEETRSTTLFEEDFADGFSTQGSEAD